MRFRKTEIITSVILIVLSLGSYFYLFSYADREIVFLYGHIGLAPFDQMTIGRYWMTGFVISGFLSILFLIFLLILKFLKESHEISLKAIFQLSLIPLIIGVLFITMSLGEPKLSLLIAISSAIALIIATVIGFSVVDDFVKDYRLTLIYLIFGLGLVPFLLLFRSIELPGKGIISLEIAILVTIFSLIGGFLWLIISYKIFKKNRPRLMNIIKGTLVIGYVGLPVLHYLFATPEGIPYITSADNFFADNILLRITNWILLVLILLTADRLTQRRKGLNSMAKITNETTKNVT